MTAFINAVAGNWTWDTPDEHIWQVATTTKATLSSTGYRLVDDFFVTFGGTDGADWDVFYQPSDDNLVIRNNQVTGALELNSITGVNIEWNGGSIDARLAFDDDLGEFQWFPNTADLSGGQLTFTNGGTSSRLRLDMTQAHGNMAFEAISSPTVVSWDWIMPADSIMSWHDGVILSFGTDDDWQLSFNNTTGRLLLNDTVDTDEFRIDGDVNMRQEVKGDRFDFGGGENGNNTSPGTYLKGFNGQFYSANEGRATSQDGSTVEMGVTFNANTVLAGGNVNFVIRKGGTTFATLTVSVTTTGFKKQTTTFARGAQTWTAGDVLALATEMGDGVTVTLDDIQMWTRNVYDS
jgi:hypothetical protein